MSTEKGCSIFSSSLKRCSINRTNTRPLYKSVWLSSYEKYQVRLGSRFTEERGKNVLYDSTPSQ